MTVKKVKTEKVLPRRILAVLLGALLIFVGVLTVIFAAETSYAYCYLLGAGLAVLGIVRLVKYYVDKKHGRGWVLDAVGGVALLIVAALFVLHPRFIISLLPYILGLTLVAAGVGALLSRNRFGSVLLPILTIVLGVVFLFNPFEAGVVFTRIFGVALTILGIIRVISAIVSDPKPPARVEEPDDGIKELEYREISGE